MKIAQQIEICNIISYVDIDHENNKREIVNLEIGIGSILRQKICCASMIRDRISAKIDTMWRR